MKKILMVFGTRPEAIKMAPLIKEFEKNKDFFDLYICVTGQHREMLDQVLKLFNIKPHYDLNIMKHGQDLNDVTTKVMNDITYVMKKVCPDLVLVHGDTTTSMATALAAFHQKIQVGHIEAGLRTYNILSPWPEEMNRQITGKISSFHFAPTSLSKQNLLSEKINEDRIIITGNTVIDALLMVINMMKNDKSLNIKLEKDIKGLGYDSKRLDSKQLVLITGHRRENFGTGFTNICKALKTLSGNHPQVDFVYPMHLNPNVRKPINQIFKNNKNQNMFFIEPLEYLPFIYLMQKSTMILTDSGGIQEEAPSLGKPVLVMRDTTERPEAIEAGTVKLIGTNYNKIVKTVSTLLEDKTSYTRMSKATNPYGDGLASIKIVNFLKINLN